MKKSSLSTQDKTILILIAAILFGTWFRIMPGWLSGFPVNDGGMFYTMIKDLKTNHFFPPLYTSYNHLSIPFAYPPLALYIGAILSSNHYISEIEVLRWLPGIINSFTIPVFYLLAKEILGDKFKSAVATLVFSLIPHMVEWLSMGGGLTRSFGTLFMMLTALFSYRMFLSGGIKSFLLTILFGSLTVLSHTESIVFAVIFPILVWLFVFRSIQGIKQALGVAVGVILIAGPWYGYVLYNHGIYPFLAAAKTGGQNLLVALLLLDFSKFTVENYIDLIGTIGLLGLLFLLSKRQFLLPALFVSIFVIQRRSGHTIANIPLAMAAGTYITDSIFLHFKENKYPLLFLFPFLFLNIFYQGYISPKNSISEESRAVYQWIAENTPEQSRFLVLTGESDAMCDSKAEWFPSLTNRHNITTIQGREWMFEQDFFKSLSSRDNIEKCVINGLECLETEVSRNHIEFDYILISYSSNINRCNQVIEKTYEIPLLIKEISVSKNYELILNNKELALFTKK